MSPVILASFLLCSGSFLNMYDFKIKLNIHVLGNKALFSLYFSLYISLALSLLHLISLSQDDL